jgi:uncharacterized membrane protein SirB2
MGGRDEIFKDGRLRRQEGLRQDGRWQGGLRQARAERNILRPDEVLPAQPSCEAFLPQTVLKDFHSMIDFYPQIRLTHIVAVLLSGGLFLLRWLAVNFDARWPMAGPVRYLSYAIDTVLLTAALMLTTVLHQYPFVHGWLTVKVVLLVMYIVLGTFALKRGRTRQIRLACGAAAVLLYAFIISVARAHHPLGALVWLQ